MSAVGTVFESEFEVDAGSSLRAKGLRLLAVVVVFLACVAVLMATARTTLLAEVWALGRLHAAVESLAQAEHDFTASRGAVPQTGVRSDARVDAAIADLRERRAGIERDLKWHADITLALVLAVELVAIGTLAALVLAYARRLAADLRTVTLRAREIASAPGVARSCIARCDELGQLARAIETLRGSAIARERAAELSRRRKSHRDTLDALGALAQRMAHEIGNPLAGIVGVAQTIHEAKHVRHCRSSGATCHPEVILDQADRIAKMSRQFCAWSELQRGETTVVNVNDAIEHTCSLLAYDRRMAGIQVRRSLGRILPAIEAPGEDVVQLLTWCLLDAARRLGASQRASSWVEVSTREREHGVEIEVADNGEASACQSASCRSACAHEASGVHGLCTALVEELRGRAEFVSINGVSKVNLWLPPLQPASSEGSR